MDKQFPEIYSLIFNSTFSTCLLENSFALLYSNNKHYYYLLTIFCLKLLKGITQTPRGRLLLEVSRAFSHLSLKPVCCKLKFRGC